jgi:flagellar biogenesis protein FliO
VPEPSGWRTLGSLLVVGGLAGASLWALKKWGQGRLPGTGGGKLRVEETLALGERRFVSILNCEEERFLVALTPQGITLLSRLDGLAQVQPGEPTPAFSEALAGQMGLPRPMPVREAEALIKGEQG